MNCKFCDKKGLFILPLRYAAVVGNEAPKLLPKLSQTLGAGVKDIPLKSAAYAPRMLRQGFVYVLIKRSGVLYWEGYYSTEDGYLYKFAVDSPPTEEVQFTCERGSCSVDASMIAIDKVKTVEKIYMLFTPHAMTLSKLNEFKSNPDGKVSKGQMQAFDPHAWEKGSRAQAHSLAPDQLAAQVPEFRLHDLYSEVGKSKEATLLMDQLFQVTRHALIGASPPVPGAVPSTRLGALAHKMRKTEAATVVLFDHIGITQELNNYRNAAFEPVERFLAKTDKEKVTNERKLAVMQAIDDTKEGFVKHGIGMVSKKLDDMIATTKFQEERIARLRKSGNKSIADQYQRDLDFDQVQLNKFFEQGLSGEASKKKWTSTYEPLLDMQEIDNFRKELEDLSRQCTAVGNERVDDQVAWINSEKLVNAFETYDPSDMGSGCAFSDQYNLCTLGMFGVPKNAPYLKTWMSGIEIKSNNLYMRAVFYNHNSLIEHARKAFKEAKSEVEKAGGISKAAGAPWFKFSKALIDAMKKADSAWDEWLRDKKVIEYQLDKEYQLDTNPNKEIKYSKHIVNLSKYHHSAEGRFFKQISTWTQALATKSGKLDNVISAVVGTLLYSKLGDLTYKIGFEEFLAKFKPETMATIVKRSVEADKLRTEAAAKKYLAQTKRAERAAASRAHYAALREAEKIDGSIAELIRHEQEVFNKRLHATIEQLDDGVRDGTNNFRQARLSVVLLSIETLALTVKLMDYKENIRVKFELAASLFSIVAISTDIAYSVVKSLREIPKYKDLAHFQKAADITRGGLKLLAGVASTTAGLISAGIDLTAAYNLREKQKSEWFLTAVYAGRGVVGLGSAGLGFAAAFSYAEFFLARLAGNPRFAKITWINLVGRLTRGANIAKNLAAGRTLMLIRLARLNWIGLAFTAVEIGYIYFVKDDELENWCQACTFRKNKETGWFNEDPYPTQEKELEELDKAFKAVTE